MNAIILPPAMGSGADKKLFKLNKEIALGAGKL